MLVLKAMATSVWYRMDTCTFKGRNNVGLAKPNTNQYSYINRTATTDGVVYSITDWARTLNLKETLAVHALYLDFSKAFDIMRQDVFGT